MLNETMMIDNMEDCVDVHDRSFENMEGSVIGSVIDDDIEDMLRPSNENVIAKEETKKVRCYRIIVVIVLTISSVAFAAFVHDFIRLNENAAFKDAFNRDAGKIFNAVGNSIDRSLVPLDTLAVTMVSYARDKNSTWPFVTLPDFAHRMSKILPQTDGVLIQYIPIVQPEDRKEWELYASQNNHWVNESVAFLENWERYHGHTSYDWEPRDIVFSDDGDIPQNVSRPMAPQWQMFPISTQHNEPYNWDWLSRSNPKSLYDVIERKTCVMSYPSLIAALDDPNGYAENKFLIDYYKEYIKPDEEPFEPIIEITYPIISNSDHAVSQDIKDGTNQTVVGFLAIGLYFREIIRGALPEGANGMIVYVDNACADTFTYQIDGPNVTYLGTDYRYYEKYGHLVVTSLMTDLQILESAYSGVGLDDEYCPYTLRIYPSKEMNRMFTSNKPDIFMFVTLLSFAILAILFASYDYSVERRQSKVLTSAVRSSALVSSLFPSSVQELLYGSNTVEEKNTAGKTSIKETNSTLAVDVCNDTSGNVDAVARSAIATLYPKTTVMFADIKGFTNWSSSRQPNHVFRLLESIYGAFDTLAKSMGVFKVETIGDTYVAVSGLPTPRRLHAITMAKFAMLCIEKMTEVCQSLAEELGSDTLDLAIRVGLNSGATTAGVLRGEKARFQLFGDTVNTAARMESNGECNKIHVTKSTAMALKRYGKGHWLTLREEPIFAKGKGLMVTYWCDPSLQRSSSSHAESSTDHSTNDEIDASTSPDYSMVDSDNF